MSQEFQRITSQLAKLQQDIFRNQLPSLLIGYNEQEDVNQFIQCFIQSIMIIQKSQFIKTIAENIVNVKQDNNRLKIQNEELKKLVKDQQYQVAKVEQTIKDLTHQKNCLYTELEDLRTRQISLAQLMNSSSIESKIKEIMKDNQILKNSIEQKDKLIQAKLSEIKVLIEKQIFLNSEIKALQNDNILFHRDLSQANNQINAQKQKINQYQIHLNSIKKQNQILKNQLHAKTNEVSQQKKQFTRFKNQNIKQQKQIRAKLENCEKIIEENVKSLKKMKDIQEQNKYLLSSIQGLKDQLTNTKAKQSQYLAKCKQEQQRIHILNNRIVNIEDSNYEIVQKLKQMAQQTQKSLIEQIKNLEQQINGLKLRQMEITNQFTTYKNNAYQQKQQIIKENEINKKNIQKCNDQLIQKIRQESTSTIDQYQNRIRQKIQQIQKCKHELQVEKEHRHFYQVYLDENNQLKAELQRLTQKFYNQSIPKSSSSQKVTFKLMQNLEIIQRLRKQNSQIRISVHTMLQSNRIWLMKQINKLARNLLEKKSECDVCNHWQKYETNKKSISDHTTRQAGQIKSGKDLRALNQKFKLIKQQNEKFGNRIQQIIHN